MAVPSDLRGHYSRVSIITSLRTKSSAQARRATKATLAKLESYWEPLRLQKLDIPGAHLLLGPPMGNRSGVVVRWIWTPIKK